MGSFYEVLRNEQVETISETRILGKMLKQNSGKEKWSLKNIVNCMDMCYR
jgi:hypothetical protein